MCVGEDVEKGVVRPCPAVRNDSVTPRYVLVPILVSPTHLFVFFETGEFIDYYDNLDEDLPEDYKELYDYYNYYNENVGRIILW